MKAKLDAALRDALVANVRGDFDAEVRHYDRAREIQLDIYAAEVRAARLMTMTGRSAPPNLRSGG